MNSENALVQRNESQLKNLLDFASKNPGIALSAAYMLLTLCGLYYSYSFYSEFGIKVLKLANISDLLIIGISEPPAIVLFCGGLLIAYLSDYILKFHYRLDDKWRPKPNSLKRSFILAIAYAPKSRGSVLYLFLFTFVFYAYLFVSWFAQWQSNEIKNGHVAEVNILNISNMKQSSAVLLGTTTNFIFTYDLTMNTANVYPVDKIELKYSLVEDVLTKNSAAQ